MLGELASIVPPSSLPVTSSLTSDTGLEREDSSGSSGSSSSKDDNSEPSNSIDRLALLRKRLEESVEPEDLDSNGSRKAAATGESSLTLTVNSTAALDGDDDDETAATINILPPTPTVPSKPGVFGHHQSADLSTEERTSKGTGSGKSSLSVEDALTPRRSLATDKDSSTSGKAVSESVTVPTSSSSIAEGGGAIGSHSNGSSTQGSPCFSPGAMHSTPDTNIKVHCTLYIPNICCAVCCY